jgi:hypothetical protein
MPKRNRCFIVLLPLRAMPTPADQTEAAGKYSFFGPEQRPAGFRHRRDIRQRVTKDPDRQPTVIGDATQRLED